MRARQGVPRPRVPLPTNALFEGHGQRRSERRAAGERSNVRPGDRSRLALEAALHDAWDDHVRDRNAGSGEDRSGKECRGRARCAPGDTEDDGKQRQQQQALGADSPRQDRGDQCKRPETEHWSGSEHARSSRR